MKCNDGCNCKKKFMVLYIVISILGCLLIGVISWDLVFHGKYVDAINQIDDEVWNIVNGKDDDCLDDDVCELEEPVDDFKKMAIKLENKEERFEVNDDLTLSFDGELEKKIDEDEEDAYMYTLKINMNGEDVDSKVFGDSKNRRIYSSNMASSFQVLKMGDLYFFVSMIAAQCDGHTVLVIDEFGHYVNSYDSVGFDANEEHNTFILTDTLDNCSLTSQVKTRYFHVIGDKILELK